MKNLIVSPGFRAQLGEIYQYLRLEKKMIVLSEREKFLKQLSYLNWETQFNRLIEEVMQKRDF